MSKIKRYIECYIPTETCNLRCHYCYITQQKQFTNKIAHFSHSEEEIAQAFSLERLGGPCLINMCAGGETLLSEEVLPIARKLINAGHYISLVTNGTLNVRFDEIDKWNQKEKSHLFIKFSFHYLEFKRLNFFDRFFRNVKLMKDSGVSFTVEITPSDELIPFIPEIKEMCDKRLGALCHVTIARDDRTTKIEVLSNYQFDEYKKIWDSFDSNLFSFKKEIFYQTRKEFCYAGDWSFCVNLETGIISKCYAEKRIGNIYDLENDIKFEAVGCNCSIYHCYNGHSFLSLGIIPELKTPTYAELRNRVCNDGTEWLQPEMKEVMQTKLSETNKEYSALKKRVINRANGKKGTTLKEIKRKFRKAIK